MYERIGVNLLRIYSLSINKMKEPRVQRGSLRGMYRQIVATRSPREVRVAVLEDHKTVELYVERPHSQGNVGNIYKGRICDVLPGMQAAFVNIGLEKNAFLHFEDCMGSLHKDTNLDDNTSTIQELYKVGQEIMVQVSKEAVGNKGPRVTQHITLPGRYMVLLPMN